VAALLVGAALVLLNLKHGTAPTLRNPALEQRSGQVAHEPRAADEARGPRPGAPAPPGPETGRDDALRGAPPPAERKGDMRSIQPPTIAPVPSGAMSKQAPANRAYEVQSTPTGENVRGARQREGFAKPPAAAPREQGAGMKPRLAEPLEENRPKVEGGEPQIVGAKDQARAPSRNEAGAAGASSATPRSAVLPPEPEAAGPAAPAGAAAREGARPSASFAEPQAEKRETRAATGVVRMCGVVKDTRGRPISSAMVTLVSKGSGASSDAEGRFCVEGPPGDQTLSVIAVGFSPLQLDVRFAPGSPPLPVTLTAVSVLGESQIASAKLRMLQGTAQTGAPVAAVPMPPESLERVETQAMRLTMEAGRARSAPRYEAAAAEWQRVRDRTPEGAANLEARFRIAEARYQAWALVPTPKRVTAADEALTSYLVRAPLGTRRDTATVWLGRVKP
jgi:Carboxypeptidase regulatory-like domain